MTASTFDRALFHDQTPALASAFDNAVDGLFTLHKPGKARLEVYTADCIRRLDNNVSDHDQISADTKHAPSSKESTPSTRTLETEVIDSAAQLVKYIRSLEAFHAFFIGQRNSYAPLSTSLELFDTLSRERAISPQFRDFILYFGDRESEIEVAPPSVRIRPISWLGRKDKSAFECLYGIRYVEPNTRTDVVDRSARWSLRQCAIYYQFTTLPTGQTWVFATLSQTCRRRLDQYILDTGSLQRVDFFEVMSLVVDTVIGNWRPYIVALSMEIEQHAAQLLGASPDNRGPIGMADAGQRQTLMLLDDKMGNSILAMRSSKDDLAHLLQFLSEHSASARSPESVITAMQETLHELDRLILKAEALQSRLGGIANLVSSFLDLSNGLALQQLGKESRRENEQMRLLSERMHKLTEKSTQDAAAIKVLTILTLVYLPLTVVTNFFSTAFIGTSGSSNRIFVTDDWWILVASAVPLTLITLYVWWIWSRIKAYNQFPWWWPRTVRGSRTHQNRTFSEKSRNIAPQEDIGTGLRHSSNDWDGSR
jgi:Mg2+ and Co2+ transporter CorA